MKRIILILAILLPMFANGQTNDAEQNLSKSEVCSSKTGIMSRCVDTYLADISTKNAKPLKTCIRTLKLGDNTSYLYVIKKANISSNVVIRDSDVVAINKALDKFIREVDADCVIETDYIENKYITENGFEIGYFVSDGKATWYMKLERENKKLVEIKDPIELSQTFHVAQKTIERLKNRTAK